MKTGDIWLAQLDPTRENKTSLNAGCNASNAAGHVCTLRPAFLQAASCAQGQPSPSASADAAVQAYYGPILFNT